MKSLKQRALVGGLVAGLGVGVKADWVQTSGPEGGDIRAFCVKAQIFLPGLQREVFFFPKITGQAGHRPIPAS